MSGIERVGPVEEYVSLRDELNQSKKYVFERPLVIVASGAAFSAAGTSTWGVVLAAALSGMLLFNLWFTTNRVMSASRIVAYIQVVLEPNVGWRGWETSLQEWREWKRTAPKATLDEFEAEAKRRGARGALMYFAPIWGFHLVLIALSLTAGVVLTVQNPSWLNLAACVVSVLGVGLVFVHWFWPRRPSKMGRVIERDILTWKHVLQPTNVSSEEDEGD